MGDLFPRRPATGASCGPSGGPRTPPRPSCLPSYRLAVLRAVVLRTAVLRAPVFLAVAFLAVVLRAGALRALVFFAAVFLAADFRGVLFLAVDFLAVDFLAVDFLAVDFAAPVRAVDFLALGFLAAAFLAGAGPGGQTPRSSFGARLVFTTASLKPLSGVMRAFFEALMRTGACVCGLRPMRAGRSTLTNLAKPEIDTGSPFDTTAVTTSVNPLRTLSTSLFSTPVWDDTAWTRSRRFTGSSSGQGIVGEFPQLPPTKRGYCGIVTTFSAERITLGARSP